MKFPFLDLLIHRHQFHLEFSVYRKATNSYMYVHFYSFTSPSVRINLAQGLFLRALRVCSDIHFDNEISLIFKHLSSLAYPSYILKKALMKARKTHFRQLNSECPTNTDFRYDNLISVPYAPSFDNLKPTVRAFGKNLVYKYQNKLSHKLCKNRLSNIKVDSGV